MLIRVNKLVSGTSIRENVEVRIENNKIAAIAPASGQKADLESEYLTPGFVDIHCHGGNGTHFFDSEAKAAEKSAEFHLKHGTTSLIASFIAAPISDLRKQIDALVRQLPLSNIIGIHLEGPYLSEIFCGAHNPDFLSNPSVAEVKTLLNDGAGWIKMITIAPELPGALESISYLQSQGVIAAIGHSDADEHITKSAIDAGASMVTHFFSAMRPIHHRISGMTLTALFDERINLELILDNVHIAPKAIKIPFNFARERIVGITDALAVAGLPDGDYLLGTTNVELRNGIAKIKGKDLLAGSTLTMDRSFKSAVTNLGFSPIEAVQAFCQRPARIMKLENVGEIAVGKDADLLLMDRDFNLQQVVFKGSLV
jgi:N-acetylglucosamine-6-phosphate deacetylase